MDSLLLRMTCGHVVCGAFAFWIAPLAVFPMLVFSCLFFPFSWGNRIANLRKIWGLDNNSKLLFLKRSFLFFFSSKSVVGLPLRLIHAPTFYPSLSWNSYLSFLGEMFHMLLCRWLQSALPVRCPNFMGVKSVFVRDKRFVVISLFVVWAFWNLWGERIAMVSACKRCSCVRPYKNERYWLVIKGVTW